MSVVYKDNLIEITDEGIVFFHYYFPFSGAKRVLFNEIESIQALPPSLRTGSWRLWGAGDLRTFFPRDLQRPKRDRIFLATLRDKGRRIGFTVENSPPVMEIFKQRGVLRETPDA